MNIHFFFMLFLICTSTLAQPASYSTFKNHSAITFEVFLDINHPKSAADALLFVGGERKASVEFSERISFYAKQIRRMNIAIQNPFKRMPLPDPVAGPIEEGMDTYFRIGNLALNDDEALEMFRYAITQSAYIKEYPKDAFSQFAANANRSDVHPVDVLNLMCTTSSPPGRKTSQQIDKSNWLILHNSTNPVYRFIALEKFDSVEQNPNELLVLYRECLIGACSYLEVRALEAISRNKDFREEVAKLLEEYIASNPPLNDGTLPGLRNNFPNIIEGAKQVVVMIRNTKNTSTATLPHSDPSSIATLATKPSLATNTAPEAKAMNSSQEHVSTPLLLWGVLIAAAVALLWLLLKGRD